MLGRQPGPFVPNHLGASLDADAALGPARVCDQAYRQLVGGLGGLGDKAVGGAEAGTDQDRQPETQSG